MRNAWLTTTVVATVLVFAASSPSFGGNGFSCTDATCYTDEDIGGVFFCVDENHGTGKLFLQNGCEYLGEATKDVRPHSTKFSLKDGSLTSGDENVCCPTAKFSARRNDDTNEGNALIRFPQCGSDRFRGALGTFQSCD